MTTAGIRPGKLPLLRLTKGVHLVTPAASQHAHVLFAQSDGRLFFVIPWLGYSLVGTTDTDFQGDPSDAAATRADVEYLVKEARRVFPSGHFDEIYYTYAGVRALVRVDNVGAGRVSRKHALHDHSRRDGVGGIVSVVGGKVTGYRAIAEEVGDLVAKRFGVYQRGSATQKRPLPGGYLSDLQAYIDSHVWPLASQLGLDRDQVEHLGSIYGSMTPRVLARAHPDPRLAARVCPDHPTILAQIAHSVEDEWALTLGDVLLRRTPIGLSACQGLDCLDQVASEMASLLCWDAPERARQVDAYRHEIEPMRRFSREAVSAV
jgi:glycerol-3-phosphate dehydrogenase